MLQNSAIITVAYGTIGNIHGNFGQSEGGRAWLTDIYSLKL